MPPNDKDLQRFGVSLEPELLDDFDRSLEELGYPSRSAALRDLIRGHLVERAAVSGSESMFGTLTLIYDHHKRALAERMLGLQHHHHESIISTLHVHVDEHNCLEVIIMKGTGDELQAQADELLSLEGVLHGRLTLTSANEMRKRGGKTKHAHR